MKSTLHCLLLFAAAVLAARAVPPEGDDDLLFQKMIVDEAQNSRLDVGVAIEDLVSKEEILYNADQEFPQGSAIRIHLVAELFRQSAAGKLSVDEVRPFPESARTGGFGVLRHMGKGTVSMSLRDYATLVIMVNDNSAANFLTDILGIDNINASLVAQGTPEIKFRRRAMSRQAAQALPNNVGTPHAVMRALEQIFEGTVVDRATSDEVIKVLALPEVSYFRRALPPGVAFAGRSGSGPASRCDVGIVMLEDRPFVLCVMMRNLPAGTDGGANYAKADALMATITRTAYQFYTAKAAAQAEKARPAGQATTSSSSGGKTSAVSSSASRDGASLGSDH
jgi:beta-lactamase class A